MTPCETCDIMREMTDINLAKNLEERLPEELAGFLRSVSEIATERGQGIFLMGGIVRDLILGRANLDIDLVVEGDAVAVAQELAGIRPGEITVHPRFKTAKIRWCNFSADFASARSETYAAPGALPTVSLSTIENDLLRRDFTVNAMAVCLNSSRFGELLDIYGGRNDLEKHLIRVLHDKSFTDDATRIWRALRYEQRLDFNLEDKTLALLKRDIPMLDTISGDRIRYELECVFQEDYPERVLSRAEELGVLAKLHPALRGDAWLSQKFTELRDLSKGTLPPFNLYMAIFTYRLENSEREALIQYLRLTKPIAKMLRDIGEIKPKLKKLSYPELKPSYIYRQLHEHSLPAVVTGMLATSSPLACQHIKTYYDKLRYVKPFLDGDYIVGKGVSPGPRVKEILAQLLEAKLDGKATTRDGEEMLLGVLLKANS